MACPSMPLGYIIKMRHPSLFGCAFVLPQHGVRSGISSSGIKINLMMASSSGQGVAAVMLPRFSTMGDRRRNCKKFIQMFKDWCKLNGWYDNKPPPEAPE